MPMRGLKPHREMFHGLAVEILPFSRIYVVSIRKLHEKCAMNSPLEAEHTANYHGGVLIKGVVTDCPPLSVV